jgi:hypothetical protein
MIKTWDEGARDYTDIYETAYNKLVDEFPYVYMWDIIDVCDKAMVEFKDMIDKIVANRQRHIAEIQAQIDAQEAEDARLLAEAEAEADADRRALLEIRRQGEDFIDAQDKSVKFGQQMRNRLKPKAERRKPTKDIYPRRY